eukprot:Gb_04993 [translate_table: standard]
MPCPFTGHQFCPYLSPKQKEWPPQPEVSDLMNKLSVLTNGKSCFFHASLEGVKQVLSAHDCYYQIATFQCSLALKANEKALVIKTIVQRRFALANNDEPTQIDGDISGVLLIQGRA